MCSDPGVTGPCDTAKVCAGRPACRWQKTCNHDWPSLWYLVEIRRISCANLCEAEKGRGFGVFAGFRPEAGSCPTACSVAAARRFISGRRYLADW